MKGLKPETKEEIMATRAQQLMDNKMAKQSEQDEEMQWAMQ